MSQLILLTATGHYFATFVRAYGDRELFARFRARFLVTPVVLAATCVGCFVSGFGPQLMVIVAAWSFWHWLAQAFGFARIYDIKAGSFQARTALLDKAIVIAGFVGVATLTDGAVATFGKLALDAGISLPGPAAVQQAQAIITVAVAAIAVAYVANLMSTIARGGPWSWQKQFMHVTTIGYYWFAFTWLPNVLIAHVFYELFHDIQYFAITWITCQGRSRRPGVTSWMKAMFRPTWLAAAGFLTLMIALGGLDAWGRSVFEGAAAYDVWIGVFLTFALLHYYYDGFIWKARESALGEDLGIQHGLRAAVVPGLRHGLAWMAFFVPLAGLVVTKELLPIEERVRTLAEIAPGDFYSQSQYAMQLTRQRDLDEALRRYERAVALNPSYGTTHLNYGAALDLYGALDDARAQYEIALKCEDNEGSHLLAHGYLAVLLLVQDKPKEADEHLKQVSVMRGEHPLGRIFGMAEAMPPSASDRRERYYRAAVALAPSNRDARYLLGTFLVEQSRFAEAKPQLRAFMAMVPDYAPALFALAKAERATGETAKAKAHIDAALRAAPNFLPAKLLKKDLERR